ncbi:integrin alpha-V-like [Dysidea avara]|uniref:integrin alpha-V-like n=1 Tax=Dysidea avara TaxID=196820 RepID=UPI003324CAF8
MLDWNIIVLFVTFLLQLIMPRPSLTLNIDTTEPIVRSSPSRLSDSDLFGYSLVLHKIRDPGDLNDVKIIVSAPHGRANERETTENPKGVIYTCPILPGNCTGLMGNRQGTDRRDADYRLFDSDQNAFGSTPATDVATLEFKGGQFLGATLKSNGRTFMACAHRYISTCAGFSRYPYGVCYISDRSLTNFQAEIPCDRNPARSNCVQVMPPEGTQSSSLTSHIQCQAGTSGDVIDDESGRTVLLGAPGSYNWEGSVIRKSQSGTTFSSDPNQPVQETGYLGYAVTTGHILERNSLDFIVSAPRFNRYIGKVFIYSNAEPQVGRPTETANAELVGDQTGAYFGFAIAAADFSNSGYDDLVVGAPMYSANSLLPENGKVYIFKNTNGVLSSLGTDGCSLEGKIPYGRFGHAIVRLGDINGDDLEDIAISAPFGEGSGTVYIYIGRLGNQRIQCTPSQEIIGSRLNAVGLSNLKSFGYSLASEVDVDVNGYNDLAVGAFASKKVFLLRTRPVAKLQVSLNASRTISITELACHYNGEARACYNVTTCLSYSGTGLPNNLVIRSELVIDSVRTRNGLPTRTETISNMCPAGVCNITLEKGNQSCFDATILLKNEFFDDSTQFTTEYRPSLYERTLDPVTEDHRFTEEFRNFPALFVIGSSNAATQFAINCGTEVCMPDLSISIQAENITFENSTGNLVDSDVIVSRVVTAINVPVDLANFGEDALRAEIVATVPSQLTFTRATSFEEDLALQCAEVTSTTNNTITCVADNQLVANSTKTVLFRFQSLSVTGAEGSLQLTFEAQSLGMEVDSSNNRDMTSLDVGAIADIFVQGSFSTDTVTLGENNPVIRSDSVVNKFARRQQVSATFFVRNRGPSVISNAMLTIRWPLRAGGNRYYLYPYAIITGGTCSEEFINPLGLRLSPEDDIVSTTKRKRSMSSSRRWKRQETTTNSTLPEPRQGIHQAQVLCSSSETDCVEITCQLRQIMPTSTEVVTISAYPDNRQYFNNNSDWVFEVVAEVTITDDHTEQPDGDSSDTLSVYLQGTAFVAVSDDEIAAWVIIVPIVVGIIVIIVTVVILYMVGFFKFKKVDKEDDSTDGKTAATANASTIKGTAGDSTEATGKTDVLY